MSTTCLPAVDGRDQLVEHVLREVHPVALGREAQLLGGEDHVACPCLLPAQRRRSAGWGRYRSVPRLATCSREQVVGLLAHHLHDLVAQRLVHGCAVDEGVVGLGAPPVELGAALAPVAPLPLPQRGGDVAVGILGVVLEPQRELPAHLGLPVERALAGLEGGGVQGAADAALEPGPVQEDAGTVDEAGLDLAGLVDLGGPGLAVPVLWSCHCSGVSRSACSSIVLPRRPRRRSGRRSCSSPGRGRRPAR